jgi:hypothetical protein
MIRILTMALVFLVGCATESSIPQSEACHEQAAAWCTHAGFGTAPGCTVWYVHQCSDAAPNGSVMDSAQDACLEAIAAGPPSFSPPECVATWGKPHA